jgi:hypothetical protein
MTDRHEYATDTQLERLIIEPRGEWLEFKWAKGGFQLEKLVYFCAALSNGGADRWSLV